MPGIHRPERPVPPNGVVALRSKEKPRPAKEENRPGHPSIGISRRCRRLLQRELV